MKVLTHCVSSPSSVPLKPAGGVIDVDIPVNEPFWVRVMQLQNFHVTSAVRVTPLDRIYSPFAFFSAIRSGRAEAAFSSVSLPVSTSMPVTLMFLLTVRSAPRRGKCSRKHTRSISSCLQTAKSKLSRAPNWSSEQELIQREAVPELRYRERPLILRARGCKAEERRSR